MLDYLNFKKSNCKNCYRCIRHCPVKSIKFADHQANVINEECILCGHCFLNCPQNAKQIRNDVCRAKELIAGGSPVYVSLAPSFVANYKGSTIESMQKALKELGFAGVEETAIGATIVKKQYEKMLCDPEQDVIITSCCHTVNMLIQKYYPAALPNLAAVKSPMQAHCMDIKRRYKDAKTVFIGPCLSKKAEADLDDSSVDCALTFEELTQWLSDEGIEIEYAEDKSKTGRARLFPTTGGIIDTMDITNEEYTYIAIDGVENCMKALEDVISGRTGKCFVEMSACVGSCIGGPAMDRESRSPVSDYRRIRDYSQKDDFDVYLYDEYDLEKEFESLAQRKIKVPDSAIEQILRQMGKTKPEDELNCGSCGYNTCRDKARAVLDGKANIGMCLPYLKEKAESFSDKIIQNTPNAVVVLNESMEVQQVNKSACELMRLKSKDDIVGDQVVRVLDPLPFIEVYNSGKNIYNEQVYLAEYRKYVEQTIIYDKSYHIIICIMRDVTEEARRREEKEQLSQKTIAIADNVIEKQMLAVQEIASLLGETTAETKVALTRLKESLSND